MIGYQENERLMRSLYGFAESDRLAGVTRGTSRRWLKGHWYADESRMVLAITPERDQPDGVSFVDLVEVIAIGKLRQRGFSLRPIRQVNEYCQLALNRDRPPVTLNPRGR
jgi:hypothetical protein